MPELPEMETIRRQIEPAIVGRAIESVEVRDERWTRPIDPREVERALVGRRIEAVERRGKYLLLRLDADRTLAMHLRMTGNLLLTEPDVEPAHLRAAIVLDDGTRLLFTDARRFGQAVVREGDGLDDYFASRLGIEPLSEALTAEELCRLASGRGAPLQAFLLNQAGVAGIGDISGDEAIHRGARQPVSPAGAV